jgi:hypothetical protein
MAIFANILHQRRIVTEAIASSKQRRRQERTGLIRQFNGRLPIL